LSIRQLYQIQKEYHKEVYGKFIDLVMGDHSAGYILEELSEIQRGNDQHMEECNHHVMQNIARGKSQASFVSIQLNSNREIHKAVKTLCKALEISASYDYPE